jgi:hypothetical protein
MEKETTNVRFSRDSFVEFSFSLLHLAKVLGFLFYFSFALKSFSAKQRKIDHTMNF